MNLKEIMILFNWLRKKNCLQEYCECYASSIRLDYKSKDIAIRGAFVWTKSSSGLDFWSNIDSQWREECDSLILDDRCKIDSYEVFKGIPKSLFCTAPFNIINDFKFVFVPGDVSYIPCGCEEDSFLACVGKYNGAILEDLKIPRKYLRDKFVEDAHAYSAAYNDNTKCSPKFLSLSSLYEYINLLFEVATGLVRVDESCEEEEKEEEKAVSEESLTGNLVGDITEKIKEIRAILKKESSDARTDSSDCGFFPKVRTKSSKHINL